MITYTDKTNISKYNIFFAKASQDLNEQYPDENITIDSLESYFKYNQQLVSMQKEAGDSYGINHYLLFPLDEDYFVIDANARSITVPSAFSKNGVGVATDEIAEILFFTIDRYFDTVDLAMQNIAIEWINADGEKGVSLPAFVNYDEIPGKILFGWGLQSEITKAGKLTFAVRLYSFYDGEIKYSLSTLTQTVTIKPNIGIDTEKLLIENGGVSGIIDLLNSSTAKDLIAQRVQSSDLEQVTLPEEPAWFSDSPYEKDAEGNKTHGYVYYVTETTDDTGTVLTPASVTIYATAPDAGTVRYSWYRYDYATYEASVAISEVPAAYAVEEVSVSSAADLTPYSAANAVLYTSDPLEDTSAEIFDYTTEITEEITLYYKVSTEKLVAINKETGAASYVGIYIPRAINRVGTKEKQITDLIIVYPPATPKYKTLENYTLSDDEDTTNQLTAEVYVEEPDNLPCYNYEGLMNKIYPENVKKYFKDSDPNVVYGVDDNGEVIKADITGTVADEYKFNPDKETYTYQWYKGTYDTDSKEVVDSEAISEADGGTKQVLTITDEGGYYYEVVGHLNGEESSTVTSNACRVTTTPLKPWVTIDGHGAQYSVVSIKNDDQKEITDEKDATFASFRFIENAPAETPYYITLSYTYADDLAKKSDDITIDWYYYTLPSDKTEPDTGDLLKALHGEYSPQESTTPMWPADKKLGDEDSRFTKDAYYFAMITNKYGENTETISSPIFYVDTSVDDQTTTTTTETDTVTEEE